MPPPAPEQVQPYPTGDPYGAFGAATQAGTGQQAGHSLAGYPGHPPGGYPQGGYPQGGYSQGGYPQGGYPQPGYPPPYGYGPPPPPRLSNGMYLMPPLTTHYGAAEMPTHIRVLAGPGKRLGARVLDGLIVVALVVALVLIAAFLRYAADGGGPSTAEFSTGSLVAVLLAILGFFGILLWEPLFVSMKGGTPGKLALGIRVVRSVDGISYPSLGAATGRYLIPLVMGLIPFGSFVDSLWLLWDRPLYQCLHDKVASTVVVEADPRYDRRPDTPATRPDEPAQPGQFG